LQHILITHYLTSISRDGAVLENPAQLAVHPTVAILDARVNHRRQVPHFREALWKI